MDDYFWRLIPTKPNNAEPDTGTDFALSSAGAYYLIGDLAGAVKLTTLLFGGGAFAVPYGGLSHLVVNGLDK